MVLSLAREKRRLAAIVSADVVGYSRLMGVDETGTLAALRNHRAELIDPAIEEHGGRIVKTMGDGLLIEFPSVVDAVRCSIDVQEGMADRNADVSGDKQIVLRIGINLGDIIIDGDDILGDGINIAARLESIAEPGGICISRRVYEDVQDRLDAKFTDGGEQELKNIARPVQVWRWGNAPDAKATSSQKALKALPDKPSIAVLPFDNMSGDPEQEYFSDGITEDIITALSKFRWFFVIARTSTFKYKGGAIDIKQVSRELGVRYVLEGSVRKGGDRIRITAQLIEAETGNHIWAERYDRDLNDIFELQDEITLTIAAAVEPELASSERQRSNRKPTSDLHAGDLFQRGSGKIIAHDHEGVLEGADLMRQAISQDPNFGRAYGFLAVSFMIQLSAGWASDRQSAMKQGVEFAKRAISIDRQDYTAHYALGRLLLLQGDRVGAIQELKMSVAINPNYTLSYFGLADAMNNGDEFEKAIEYIERAIRLSPNDPILWLFYATMSTALKGLGDFEKAIEIQERVCRSVNASYVQYLALTTAYAAAGRLDEAAETLTQARKMEPDLSIEFYKVFVRNSNHMSEKRLGQMVKLLRMSGLPEN
jgi:adenylate cyclase